MGTDAATGIGAAMASGLAIAGAHVVGVDLNWDDESEASGDTEQADCDATGETSVRRCVGTI